MFLRADHLTFEGKLFWVFCVCIGDQSFNNFENNTMKLSLNEAQLTVCGLATALPIQQTCLDFKTCLRTQKVSGPFEKWTHGKCAGYFCLKSFPRSSPRSKVRWSTPKKHKLPDLTAWHISHTFFWSLIGSFQSVWVSGRIKQFSIISPVTTKPSRKEFYTCLINVSTQMWRQRTWYWFSNKLGIKMSQVQLACLLVKQSTKEYPFKTKFFSQSYTRVEPPLTATSPQSPPFYNRHYFCPGGQSIHF